ncbi:MAG: TonB-dependent receptor [Panacagrimonas sp.]
MAMQVSLFAVWSPVALTALVFPQVVAADERVRTEAPTLLETIVVEASPFGHSADALVQPVDVLTGEELERNRHGTIGDVLANRPGIGNASFGPGVGRPVIRGQGGPRVQILENGIGSMDASAISADHAATVDPLGADQVEVIKGPATLIYGGAASAGVVNLVDDRLPDTVTPGLRMRGNFSYGDNGDETNTAARARYGVGEFQFGVQYSLRDADDFSIPGYATRAGLAHDHDHGDEHAEEEPERYGVLQNSSLKTENLGASAAWANDRGMLGAAVTRFESNYGIAGHTHAHEEGEVHDDEAEQSHDGVRIDLEQTRVDLRGLLREPFGGFDSLEARVGVNDYRHREITPEGEVGTTFDVQEVEGRVQLQHQPLSQWVGIGGVQVKHRDFGAVGLEAFVPPSVTRDIGVFLIEGREFGRHRFEAGVRIDSVTHTPQPSAVPDRDFAPYSLSTGANFLLGSHLHLRVNAQHAQRAPAIEELYAYGPHVATSAFERGSLALDPETANSIDIGLGRDGGRWSWDLGAFYNRINDYIYLQEVDAGLNADGSGNLSQDGVADRVSESGDFDPNGELLLLDFRQREAEFYGAEISTRLQIVQTASYRLSIRGFGDIVRARLASGSENLPRITPVRLGVAAEAGLGPVSAGLGYTRVMEQDRTAPLETQTPGHDLLSADLGYTLRAGGTDLTLYARGRNLLDEKQRLSTSFLKDISPQPGRSIFVGMRFDFGGASS